MIPSQSWTLLLMSFYLKIAVKAVFLFCLWIYEALRLEKQSLAAKRNSA